MRRSAYILERNEKDIAMKELVLISILPLLLCGCNPPGPLPSHKECLSVETVSRLHTSLCAIDTWVVRYGGALAKRPYERTVVDSYDLWSIRLLPSRREFVISLDPYGRPSATVFTFVVDGKPLKAYVGLVDDQGRPEDEQAWRQIRESFEDVQADLTHRHELESRRAGIWRAATSAPSTRP
jgi:hypothetical protein